jgi:hypothetical protein
MSAASPTLSSSFYFALLQHLSCLCFPPLYCHSPLLLPSSPAIVRIICAPLLLSAGHAFMRWWGSPTSVSATHLPSYYPPPRPFPRLLPHARVSSVRLFLASNRSCCSSNAQRFKDRFPKPPLPPMMSRCVALMVLAGVISAGAASGMG